MTSERPAATGHAARVADPALLRECVHCGLCLSACPTYVELGTEMDSPRGRIYLVKALEEGTLEPTPEVVRHLDLCLGCRACESACPSGVRYGRIIEDARAYAERAAPRSRWDAWRRADLRSSARMIPLSIEPRRSTVWRAPLIVLREGSID